MDPREVTKARRAGIQTRGGGSVEELVRYHWRRLAGYIRWLGAGEGEIDDIMQEVWVRVLGGEWDGRPALLLKIARQRLMDARRKKQPIIDGGVIQGDETIGPGDKDDLLELIERLKECLERLRVKQPDWHAAIIAVYYEGADQATLAAQMKLNPTTLRTRLSRAKAVLRECVGGATR